MRFRNKMQHKRYVMNPQKNSEGRFHDERFAADQENRLE